MASNSKIKIKLQEYEKFALREGWLNIRLIMVKKNPAANRKDIFIKNIERIQMNHSYKSYFLIVF